MTLTLGTMIPNNGDSNIELTLLTDDYVTDVPGTITRIPNVLINLIFIKFYVVSTVTCIVKMSNQRHREVEV